jgi:predicted DNA-binding ribbon-helix-helix protein
VISLDPQLSLFDFKVTENKVLKIALDPSDWKELERMAQQGAFTLEQVVAEIVHSFFIN